MEITQKQQQKTNFSHISVLKLKTMHTDVRETIRKHFLLNFTNIFSQKTINTIDMRYCNRTCQTGQKLLNFPGTCSLSLIDLKNLIRGEGVSGKMSYRLQTDRGRQTLSTSSFLKTVLIMDHIFLFLAMMTAKAANSFPPT